MISARSQRRLFGRTLQRRPRCSQFTVTTRSITGGPTSTPLKTSAPTAPRVISRRGWEQYKKQNSHLYKRPAPTKTKSADDEKPWPKSVIYAGYVLGGTLIPYLAIWLSVNNDDLRESMVLPAIKGSYWEELLRGHFGEAEWDQVPYPDQVALDDKNLNTTNSTAALPKIPVPRAFMGEVNVRERHQRNIIDEENHGTREIPVRVQVYGSDQVTILYDEVLNKSVGTTAVSGNILPSNNIASMEQGSSVAVEFPDTEDDGITTTDDSSTTLDAAADSTTDDPLYKRINTFSLWHYQPVAPASPSDGKSQQNQMSDTEIKMALLKDQILRLEQELRNGLSRRAVDDIMADLNIQKRELQRLKWKKWMPW